MSNSKKKQVKVTPVEQSSYFPDIIPPVPPDNVNHPPHYKRGKVECIDAVDAITTDMPGTYAHYTATILTYMWRWYFKNGVEDLKKARWYLNKLIDKLES